MIFLVSFAAAAAAAAGAAGAVLEHRQTSDSLYLSHDLSSLGMLEKDGGAEFYDAQNGNASMAVEGILKAGGMNTAKLRLFVNPTGNDDAGKYDLNYTLALANRFVSQGFRLILNMHFSDTWADPGRQNIPAAWPTDPDALAATLRTYVADTLKAFCRAGAGPNVVMLGNENSHGMLWPVGRFEPYQAPFEARVETIKAYARLYKAARTGVDDAVAAGPDGCASRPDTAIHFDAGWNAEMYGSIYSALFATGIVTPDDVDVFGLTLYPFYGNKGTFANLELTASQLVANYSRKVHVLETNWPVDCDGSYLPPGQSPPTLSEPTIPISAQGQLQWVRGLLDIIRRLPNNTGQGVSYWEPAWLNHSTLGSGGCDDLLLFDQEFASCSPKFKGYSRPSVNMFGAQ